ncbi:MAG: STAS domain-containing protein [Bacteroidota bacterium]
MINISITNDDAGSCIVPEGRLDTLNSSLFNEKMNILLESEEYLIIDFSKCNYLASSGIRSLITAAKKLGEKGGALLIAGLLPEVFQVLEMAGLHTIFRLFKDVSSSRDEILRLKKKASQGSEIQIGGNLYQVDELESRKHSALLWQHNELVGCNELPVSVGIGSPAETLAREEENQGLFITIGNSSGFIPHNTTSEPEFRVLKDAAGGGIFLDWALSFGREAGRRFRLITPGNIQLGRVLDDSILLSQPEENETLRAVLIADFDALAPTITLECFLDQQNSKLFQTLVPEHITRYLQVSGDGNRFLGARFLLNQMPELIPGESFLDFANRTLRIENIDGVEIPGLSVPLSKPLAWLFYSDAYSDADSQRIQVETDGKFVLEPYKAYLTRRLYADSARVVVRQLHGGFSAQTFQVESYDHHGRKLRPTVLKIANRDIIAREADRCQRFSLPYIMNNSAMVLGTAFFCDTGALRYNFVGIGGGQSQLKWLTHYFHSWPVEELEPLFDKIFLQILSPWYAQPVKENIFLYRDHDPTFTFFPLLCETAAELFSISADEQYFRIEETGEQRINPYWFLKHGYHSRRDDVLEYYTSICHGDLNMQNILLDKEMNVYLIDFSETRPRSVVSDFARLEAIFMIEHAPIENGEDLEAAIRFTTNFYDTVRLDQLPEHPWEGKSPEIMNRNLALTLKMRKYALASASGENSIVPYYLALLEWILPIVCYGGVSLPHKKLSACVAGLLCEKIMECD